MSDLVNGADAAFAANIPPNMQVAFGYYGGPRAYRVWTANDWKRFPGKKVPIWVGGYGGDTEGHDAVKALRTLRVPDGCITALDMETRIDRTYVDAFDAVLHAAGYKVWVYGSSSTVFNNPQCNGYWIAHYDGIRSLPPGQAIRAKQYAEMGDWDANVVRDWTLANMWA